MGDESYPECQAQELFDEFVSASTCRAALRCFSQLCKHLQLDHSTTEKPLYQPIKRRLNYWKANALWAKLDRRAAQQEYQRGRVCRNMTCVIIGAGPCGLRTAVELCFMGARVVVLEKRESFSRNNVLHLWPFTIYDLRGLGAKKFYGKFCAGSIDHISIRQLQLVLLKVALLLGAEVHVNVEFKQLVEPPEDQHRNKEGWRMEVSPKSHPVSQMEFDVIIGADGRRNTLPGFRRKEFRGKLAIAITANFKNRNTSAEAKVEEISGVAFIFNQRFFQELRQETGIDLENIVYYKDDTHYFVMTAKKQSLLDKGVILQDFPDTEQLLSRGNVDQDALQAYAREAADFSTNHQLPILHFAMNHYGQPDVAMFDFTCMYASENAALIRQRHGHQLLVTLVGDSLLEPFWPMGTGVARGFLAALDSAWMIRSWAQGGAPLDVLAERESLYRLLPQTTPENMQKSISLFTVDPVTRYVNISPLTVTPAQVRHLVDTGKEAGLNTSESNIIRLPSPRLSRQESFSQSNQLLTWCQQQTHGYRGVAVCDLTTSWKSGLALCALIHRCRPDLIDYDSLDESSVEENIHLAFDVAEQEFGISPLMTVEEMSSVGEPDSLSMVMYLSQFYQLHKESLHPAGSLSQNADLRAALFTPASLLSRLGTSPSRKRNPKLPLQEHGDALGKRRRTSPESGELQEVSYLFQSRDFNGDFDDNFVGGTSRSRVRLMANQLQAKLDEGSATCVTSSSSSASALRQQVSVGSDVCFFCKQKVYVMERLSAEGLFFHRSCFRCDSCSAPLRLVSYSYNQDAGKFRCLQHPDCRPAAPRKRATPTGTSAVRKNPRLLLQPSPSSDVSLSGSLSERRRSSGCTAVSAAASVMVATPERIELENCRKEEEVPEEVQNQVNLSQGEGRSYMEVQQDQKETEKESNSQEKTLDQRFLLPNIDVVLLLKPDFSVRNSVKVSSEEEEDEGPSCEEEEDEGPSCEEEEDEGPSCEEEEDEGPSCVTSQEVNNSRRETLREEEEEEEGSAEDKSSDGRPLLVEGEYSPWETERRSDVEKNAYETTCLLLFYLWDVLVPPSPPEFPPPGPPVQRGSAPSPLTPPTAPTPSTASFATSSDSTPDPDITNTLLSPVVVMETAAQKRPTAGGRGSFDDITPELPQKKPLLQQEDRGAEPEEEEESGGMKRRSHRDSPPPTLPLVPGGGALLLHLKKLREAPPPGQVELGGGGARGLLKAVLPGNRKEQKRRGGTLPAEKSRRLPTNHSRDTGDDAIRKGDVTGEESTLESSTLLQRCSLKPGNNVRSPDTTQPIRDKITEYIKNQPIRDKISKQQKSANWGPSNLLIRTVSPPLSSSSEKGRQRPVSPPDLTVERQLGHGQKPKGHLGARSKKGRPDTDSCNVKGLEQTVDQTNTWTVMSWSSSWSPEAKPNEFYTFLTHEAKQTYLRMSEIFPCYSKFLFVTQSFACDSHMILWAGPKITTKDLCYNSKSFDYNFILPLNNWGKNNFILCEPDPKLKQRERQTEACQCLLYLITSLLKPLKRAEAETRLQRFPSSDKQQQNVLIHQKLICDLECSLVELQLAALSHCGEATGSYVTGKSTDSCNVKGLEQTVDQTNTWTVMSWSSSCSCSCSISCLNCRKFPWRKRRMKRRTSRRSYGVKVRLTCPASDAVSPGLSRHLFQRKKRVRDGVPDSDGQSSCPTEVLGVLVPPKEPSSLSVREAMFQNQEGDGDGDLDAKITRRVQRAARRQAKKEQLKRLHKAQMIQRQLQQVEVKQRELEERGVMVEKALRGEAGLGKLDNLVLMQQWFRLVQQKNSLVRYESELMIFARELQLEDRQSRLQQELRERMAVDDHLKGEEQLGEERRILEEMLEVVEQRDALVALLEEQRLLDRQQDQNLEVLLAGALSWA
uniref:F-actin monooxygenase n=1 Tax=Poecilia formosa TaxID=48698 RepID=A0A087XBX3_POEFO